MEPLGWEDIPKEVMNERVARRALYTRNMTLAEIDLKQGAIVPLHHHANEQITTVQSGRLLFRMNGREIVVRAGQMLEIPPDVEHQVEALEDSIAIDVFAPPRLDWKTGDDAYLRQK